MVDGINWKNDMQPFYLLRDVAGSVLILKDNLVGIISGCLSYQNNVK